MRKTFLTVACLFMMIGLAAASTLSDVKARGKLLCGVNSGLLGFAQKGDDGKWAGFDVDYCRAVAAAVLGDAGIQCSLYPLLPQRPDRRRSRKTPLEFRRHRISNYR